MKTSAFLSLLALLLVTACDGVFDVKALKNSVSIPSSISAKNFSPDPGVVDSEYLVRLEYETSSGEATQCSVSNLNHLTQTSPCTCISGECTVGITPDPSYTGPANFDFTVGNGNYQSNTGKATFNVDPVVPFITTWKTDNAGTSNSDQITIPLSAGYNINFVVDWGDGTQSTITSETDPDLTHTYAGGAGTYTVTMSGEIGWFNFNSGGDRQKILEVTQWGNYRWRTFENIFRGASNVNFTATDAPNLGSAKSMNLAFQNATSFNSPMGHWDISSIETLYGTFAQCAFNQDIGDWNTSKVTDMRMLFNGNTVFNQDISRWNTSKVKTFMRTFFQASSFNQNLNNWNTSSAETMTSMFSGATIFNGNISSWNVSKVTNFSSMFANTSNFNGNITNWNVSNATNFSSMFGNATAFNRPIGNWNMSKATTTAAMFSGATAFNQDITQWKLDNVENISSMFYGISFNQDITHWRMLKLTDMSQTFRNNPTFNRDISQWPVGNVTSMRGLFDNATAFNQDISGWDVSKVTDMDSMFRGTSFNQDISNWNVALVTNMQAMFYNNADFNQNLTGWNVNAVIYYASFDVNTDPAWTQKPNF